MATQDFLFIGIEGSVLFVGLLYIILHCRLLIKKRTKQISVLLYEWTRETQQVPVAKQILRRKWGWIGHTLRKPASSTTHQALTWSPQGKRKRGRPRNSWRQDTEVELKQQVTNWSGMARAVQKRVRWRGVVDGLCSTGSDGRK